MSDIERILIRLPNWLGDLLLARPLLHALRRARAGAELCGVAPADLLGLLERDGVLDRSEPWPLSRAARAGLTRRLRAERPAATLVLPPSFSGALFAWGTGAAERLGYAGGLRGPLLTRRLRRPARGETHLSAEYLALAAPLGATPVELPVLALPERAHREAAAILAEAGAAAGRLALLGPGARYGPAKRWDPARFVDVGARVVGRGFTVLVCGAGAETEVCAEVAGAIGRGAVSLAGRVDLLTQAALCARAAVALCNDSGLAHLAAAVGAPTVVLFGSTSSAWSAPLGPRVRVVQHSPVCAPCFRRRCAIGYRCLEAIGVAEVDRACRELAA